MTAATEIGSDSLSYSSVLQVFILFVCLEIPPLVMMPTILIVLHRQKKEDKSLIFSKQIKPCNRSSDSGSTFTFSSSAINTLISP